MAHEFALNVTIDKETGDTLAVYFQIRRGKANRVREFADGNALANYSSKGELLGIELLAPCKASVVDRIAKRDERARRFVKQTAPRPMLVGAR